jgi:hypothetical protein
MKRRFPKLGRWLAGVYLLWSVVVFFGSLGSDSHDWWPIFLYPITWPLSILHGSVESRCLDWLIPNPRTAPTWVWTLNDYLAGAFYIIVGTIWVWFIGRVLSGVATVMFAFKDERALATGAAPP